MNKITKTQSNAAEGWIALLSDWRTFRAKQIPNKTGKKKFNILLANPKFVDAVFKLRRRDEFVIPPQGFQYEEAAIDWAKKLFSRNKDRVLFETVITKLLHKFRATDRWRSIIEFFILFNTTNFDHLIPPPFDLSIRDSGKAAQLELILHKDTTWQDIRDAWSVIEKYKQTLIPFGRPIKKRLTQKINKVPIYTFENGKKIEMAKWKAKRYSSTKFERRMQVLRLKNEGHTASEISKRLKLGGYERVPRELERLNKTFDENELY